eukprot:6192412-Pleurochrysis_carterae.AAC.2
MRRKRFKERPHLVERERCDPLRGHWLLRLPRRAVWARRLSELDARAKPSLWHYIGVQHDARDTATSDQVRYGLN